MINFASKLNRSITDEFRPAFEIIYAAEAVFLICVVFFLPVITWIALNAVPLHRNLRYTIAWSVILGWIGSIARGILLVGQLFSTDSEEWKLTLGAASFARRIFFSHFGIMMFGITAERFVSTQWWSWYEKQGSDTLWVLIVITVIIDIAAAQLSYTETYGITGSKEYAPIVFTIFAIVAASSGIIYIVLLFFNMREVAKLSRRGADEYSLARTYQLRENVAVMKMLLRVAFPFAIICTPMFIFMAAFIFLPSQYQFFRLLSMALFDLWAAIITLVTSLAFPMAEQRFRRPAFRLKLYRMCMPTRFQSDLGENITKVNPVGTSEHYFDWLNRDLI